MEGLPELSPYITSNEGDASSPAPTHNGHPEEEASDMAEPSSSASDAGSSSASDAGSSSASNAPAAASPYDQYAEMFPSLPTSSAPAQKQHSWTPTFASKNRDVSERFEIEPEELRPQAFSKDSNDLLKQIMDETKTKIELYNTKNRRTVLISGRADDVAEAKKKLRKALTKPYEVKLTVLKEFQPSLIGKGGSKLKALQDQTGAKITVPKQDDTSNEVILTGDKEAIQKAKRMIEDMLQEKMNFARETISVEEKVRPFVLDSLKTIAQETGAKILPPFADSTENEIVISGNKDHVAEAYKQIKTIIVEKQRTVKTIPLSINKKQHRFVIGPKGVNIGEILAATGCHISVPPQDDPSDVIKISGDSSNLTKAIELVLEKADSVCLEEIKVEGALLQRYVRLKGRQQLKELEKGTKVIINIGPTNVDVQGPKEEVADVRKKVIDLLSEFKKLHFESFEVAPELLKFVIGKKGQNIQKIKAEHNVDVVVPHEDDDEQTVCLAGSKDKVKVAKEILSKSVKEMANMSTVEFKVEAKFHKTIVGKKGETIKKLNEDYEQCSIRVPKEEENSETIVLRGPKEEVEKLKKQIVKLVEDTRHYEIMHNYTEEIMIEKKAIKYIVGKGGAAINKIRDTFEVKIEIENSKEEEKDDKKDKDKGKPKGKPSTKEPTDKVTIQGEKKKVEQAKQALLNKAQEIIEGGGHVTEELNIERKYHGSLIGAQGKFVKSLIERHSVSVHFPRSDAPSDTVVVSGMKKSVEKAKEELFELLEYEKSVGFTKTMTADNSILKQVMGVGFPKGKLLQIMSKTNTQVDFEGGDKDGKTIVVKGKEKDVEAAIPLLQSYIDGVSSTVNEEINVDPKFHGILIGVKGAKIREISEKNPGVEIKFPADKTSSKVMVMGPKKQVQGAKNMINEIVKNIESEKASQASKSFEVSRDYFPGLREYVRNHGDSLPAKVFFPKQGDKTEALSIRGKEKDIDTTIELLKENLQESVTFTVPRNLYRSLLSEGKIKDLNTAHGIVIRFPERNSPSEEVLVRGKKTSLEAGLAAFKALIAETESKVAASAARDVPPADRHTEKLNINPKFMGRVIGKGGSNIREISDISGARIDLEKNEGVVHITGTKEAVEFAKKELSRTIDELESRVSEDIKIDGRHLNRIVGPRFANISRIQDDFRVSISVNKQTNVINVSGAKEDVKTSVEYLKELIKEVELEAQGHSARKEREEPRPQQSSGQPQQQSKPSTSQASIANDPFFAPPPQAATIDRTSVWGAKMN